MEKFTVFPKIKDNNMNEIVGFIILGIIQLIIVGFVCMGCIYIINMIPFIIIRALIFGFGACVVYGIIDNLV